MYLAPALVEGAVVSIEVKVITSRANERNKDLLRVIVPLVSYSSNMSEQLRQRRKEGRACRKVVAQRSVHRRGSL